MKLDLPWYFEVPLVLLLSPLVIVALPFAGLFLVVREALRASGVIPYEFEKKSYRGRSYENQN